MPYQTVPPSAVLQTLTEQLRLFYRQALEDPQIWTKHLDPAARASYDWAANPEHAAIAEREAHLRADEPIVSYTEARSPFVTTALWQQCHGALSQVFFTVPMQVQDGSESSFDNHLFKNLIKNAPLAPTTVTEVDAYVRAAVDAAFAHSPLFRHYNVSYVPSDSRLCRTPAGTGAAAVGRVRVGAYAAGAATLNASNATLPAYGPDSFPMHGCFCGWPGRDGRCFPPDSVCAAAPGAAGPGGLPRLPAGLLPAAPARPRPGPRGRSSRKRAGCRACSATRGRPRRRCARRWGCTRTARRPGTSWACCSCGAASGCRRPRPPSSRHGSAGRRTRWCGPRCCSCA